MNITINTALLAKKLKLVEKIAPQKAIIPALSNVKLRAEHGELFLSTTNMEISMTTSCQVQVNAVGEITVPVKKLLDLVNQITEEQTHCMLEKNHLRIAAGAFKMRLATLPAADFPKLPDMPDGGLLLPGDLFKTMIKRVRYAISDADKRYFMNGALLSLTDTTLALVATDGKRLALTATKRTTPGASFEVVIPTKTLDALVNDEDHEDIMFAKDIRQMFFASDVNVLTSRMADGAFPNYKRIIPAENKHVLKIPRASMLQAIKRVSLASGDSRAVSLNIDGTSLSLVSADAAVGDAHEHVNIVYDGPAFKLAFDYNFIIDFLEAATDQTVTLALRDAAGPTLWSDGNRELINVIMQMRA
jgi:DNA polymerase-3 subunit beta